MAKNSEETRFKTTVARLKHSKKNNKDEKSANLRQRSSNVRVTKCTRTKTHTKVRGVISEFVKFKTVPLSTIGLQIYVMLVLFCTFTCLLQAL